LRRIVDVEVGLQWEGVRVREGVIYGFVEACHSYKMWCVCVSVMTGMHILLTIQIED